MKRLAIALSAWLLATTAAVAQIITGSVPNTFVNGTIIDATQVNADYTYIINQVNTNAAKNGVNSDITALISLTTPLTPAQSGSNVYYGTTTGTANALAVTSPVPANFTLAYGKSVRSVAIATNTGNATIAVNGLAATPIYKNTTNGPALLTGGEIKNNQFYEVWFDGINFRLLDDANQYGGFGPLTALAVAATTDLGTIPSHNINTTGVATAITSFGSSASTSYPIYLIRYNAAHTLTNSANIVLLGGNNRTAASGDQQLLLYSGAGVWYELAYFPAIVRLSPTMANALTTYTATGTTIAVQAKEVVLDNGAGASTYVDSFFGGGTCTINMAINGQGGLDTGVFAANTWYYIYMTGTGDSTNPAGSTNCIASASATAPTLPAGTPYRLRVGATRTYSAAATLWPVMQQGATVTFTSALSTPTDNRIASGILGTCGAGPLNMLATPTVWGTYVPSSAAAVTGSVTSIGGGTQSCVASFNDTAAITGAVCQSNANAASIVAMPFKLNYVGTATLFYCSSGIGGNAFITGWVDHVNAN